MKAVQAQAGTTDPVFSHRRRWLVALTVAVLVLGGTIFLITDDDEELRLADLPQGVSAHEFDGQRVFVARTGDNVRVFLADARHLPGDTLWWCPNERIFFEVEHGSQFSIDGLKIGGPARGGLNEHPSEIDGDRVIVDTDRVVKGSLDRRGDRPPEVDDADWSLPIDSGPGSFCQDPVA